MNQSIGVSHAERFSRLIVQTNDGRFEPLHTLANDVAHKIARRDKFEIPGRGTMNAMEMMMDMLVNPDFWKEQKIIYVKDKSIQSLIGITGNYAAITDFLDKNNNYKLMELVSTAYRKNPAEQNTFDKEIIKVDERANIVMMMLQGSMMKIFPAQNVANNQWVSWTDSLAVVPLTGSISILNDELQLTPFNYANIFNYYLNALQEGIKTGDYKNADKVCGYIDNIQRQSAVAGLLPSPASVTREIFYNNANIFEGLRNIYAMLSIALLILAFTENLSVKKNKIISIMLNLLSALLIIAFLYHTFGMALRWNLTGHAPWSNGYEALLLIAWASLLAGISFMRYSKITLAATALLAFAILMTAGHSSYDPQLTNLQPVLKSYWLIIHVATLTISYGFLGLGFFLGLINLLLFNLKSEKNEKRLDLLIRELTYINEMNLTIGLFLATLGTFLGGVWANESWGRYWGWDAKETWALIIVITYTIVLHFRLVPKMKGEFIFNAGAVIAFGSVLMTFIGVNYYLSKGMHSYAAGDTPVFPVWAWVCIVSLIALMLNAARNNYRFKKNLPEY
jgi:cytochrome c-type biogenesis protein CcsB